MVPQDRPANGDWLWHRPGPCSALLASMAGAGSGVGSMILLLPSQDRPFRWECEKRDRRPSQAGVQAFSAVVKSAGYRGGDAMEGNRLRLVAQELMARNSNNLPPVAQRVPSGVICLRQPLFGGELASEKNKWEDSRPVTMPTHAWGCRKQVVEERQCRVEGKAAKQLSRQQGLALSNPRAWVHVT